VDSENGKIFAVCAQSPNICSKTQESWNLGFDIISDPHNSLAKEFSVVISPRYGYPHGMCQPAVLVAMLEEEEASEEEEEQIEEGDEDEDYTTLYFWKIIPSIMNSGGASDRPLLSSVWSIVLDKLNGVEVDPSREENIELTSKFDWRSFFASILNFIQSIPSFFKKVPN